MLLSNLVFIKFIISIYIVYVWFHENLRENVKEKNKEKK